MDGINEVGRYLKKTAKQNNFSLKRPVVPQISQERIRDIFDSDNPVEAVITTPSAAKRITLDVYFGRKLPALGCCADCMCGITESYTSDALINGSIYVNTPYVEQSTIVYLDGVQAVKNFEYVEANPATGQIAILVPATTIVVSYVYTTGNCTEAVCLDNVFDCGTVGFTYYSGLTTVFSDRFDRPPGSIPSGGCGRWVGSINSSTGTTTETNIGVANGTAFLSNDIALVGGGYVSGKSWEILALFDFTAANKSISVFADDFRVGFSLSVSSGLATPSISGNWEGYYDTDSFGTIFTSKTGSSITANGAPFAFESTAKYYIRCVQFDGGWGMKVWKESDPEPSGFLLQTGLADIDPEALEIPSSVAGVYDYYLVLPTMAFVSFTLGPSYFVLVGAALDSGDWGTLGTALVAYEGSFCAEIPDGLTRFGYNCFPANGQSMQSVTGAVLPSVGFSLSFPHFEDNGDGLGRLITYSEIAASWNTVRGHPQIFRVTGTLVAIYPGGDEMAPIPVQVVTYPGTGPMTFLNRAGFPSGGVVASYMVPPTQTPIPVNFLISTSDAGSIRWGLKIPNVDSLINPLPFLSGPFLFPNNHGVTVEFGEYRVEAIARPQCTAGPICGDCADVRCPKLVDNFDSLSSDFTEQNITYQYAPSEGLLVQVDKDFDARFIQSGIGSVEFESGDSQVNIRYSSPFDCQTGAQESTVEATFDFKFNDWNYTDFAEIAFGGDSVGFYYFIDLWEGAVHLFQNSLGSTGSPTILPDTWTSVKIQVSSKLSGLHDVKLKIWPSASSEPAAWTVENSTSNGLVSQFRIDVIAGSDAADFVAEFRNLLIDRVV